MPEGQKSSYHGRVRVTSGETTTERGIIIRELGEGRHRVTIPEVGQGEIEVHEGHFENQPWAAPGRRPNTPELHRVDGVIETMGDELKGRFRVHRNGKTTAEGEFSSRKRRDPPG